MTDVNVTALIGYGLLALAAHLFLRLVGQPRRSLGILIMCVGILMFAFGIVGLSLCNSANVNVQVAQIFDADVRNVCAQTLVNSLISPLLLVEGIILYFDAKAHQKKEPHSKTKSITER